jgi:hypothetical protein
MKVFIVALLVAAAAAQSFDYKYNTEHMLKKLLREKELTGDLVEKKFGGIRDLEMYPRGIDMPITGRVNTIVSIEELYNTELFQEYLNIPLFRYFLVQHPIAFKRYLESPLFQKFFWTHPIVFKQYFKNPVLFYKYIVPQVEIYSVDVNTDVLDRDTVFDRDVEYGVDTPFVGHNKWNLFNKYNMFNKNHKFTTYKPIKHLLEKLVLRNMFPLMDNTEEIYPEIQGEVYPWNMHHNTDLIKYKYILDKIYNHLYNKRPVTEVMTDVKVVEPTKVIDENVIIPENRMMNRMIDTVDMKDLVLKKLLLNKIRYGKLVGETETPRELMKELELEEMIPRHRTPSMYEKVLGDEWTTSPYKHLYGRRTFEKYPIEY